MTPGPVMVRQRAAVPNHGGALPRRIATRHKNDAATLEPRVGRMCLPADQRGLCSSELRRE